MRSAFRLTLLACLGLVFATARGESTNTSDIFLNAFLACGSGEKLEAAGDKAGALASWKRAISLLDQVSREDPTWKPDMVKRRRDIAAEAVVRLEPGAGKGDGRSPKVMDQDALAGPLPSKGGAIIPGTEEFAPPKPKGSAKKTPAESVPPSDDTLLQGMQSRLNKLRDDLANAKGSLDLVTREKEDLVKKLDKALKEASDSAEKQAKLEKRAGMAEDALLKAQKEDGQDSAAANAARAEIAELRKQLRNVKIERDAEREISEQLGQSIGSMRSRTATAYEERDAAKRENKEFPGKIAEMQKQIDKALSEKGGAETKLTKVQAELAKVMIERDDVIAQVGKMKDAQKQVDKLMADNTTLMAKLTDAEGQIKNFKAQGEDKDKQIASLRVEVGNVKQQLADAKKQSDTYQQQMSTLQGKLEAQAKELTQIKSDAKLSEAERKRLAEENDTLRGIVVRQMKQQAVRDKTKQLVLTELGKLAVGSKALLDQIEFLGQPVVKLTEKEKKLFKQPTIEIGDAEISIAAPKETAIATAPPPATDTKPMTDDKASAPLSANAPPNVPVPGADPAKAQPPVDLPKTTDATKPAKAPDTKLAKNDTIPSKTPPEGELPTKPADPKMTDASGTPATASPSGEKSAEPSTNIPGGTPGKSPTKAPAGNASTGTTADTMTAPETGSPAVPPELLSQARDAKEQFDKGNYRDAEKIYEKILQKAPNNLYILSNLGVVRFRAQKLKLAEEAFKKAIAIAPEDAFSRCTLGIVYYSQGKFDDAVNELTKALAINPKNATAHNYLGITASQKGWQEAAQKELETAVAIDPQYADAHFNLAVVFATMQPPQKEPARKHYQLATSLGAEPDSALEQLIK